MFDGEWRKIYVVTICDHIKTSYLPYYLCDYQILRLQPLNFQLQLENV